MVFLSNHLLGKCIGTHQLDTNYWFQYNEIRRMTSADLYRKMRHRNA